MQDSEWAPYISHLPRPEKMHSTVSVLSFLTSQFDPLCHIHIGNVYDKHILDVMLLYCGFSTTRSNKNLGDD